MTLQEENAFHKLLEHWKEDCVIAAQNAAKPDVDEMRRAAVGIVIAAISKCSDDLQFVMKSINHNRSQYMN